MTVDAIAEEIIARMERGPVFFADVMRTFPHEPYRDLLLAWSQIRSTRKLGRDEDGRYVLK
ncbi:MAG: hypothetical protein M1598_05130 [Actinobacteria bacterium]|nr:hypothetical protein [Actinomycetota bacterium]